MKNIYRILLLLTVLLLANDVSITEARRGGGRSSYRGGGGYYRSSYKRTYTPNYGAAYRTNVIVIGYRPPVIGVVYYNSVNNYYYDGTRTYRNSSGSPVVVIVIVLIIVLLICIIVYSQRNRFSDGYDEVGGYTEEVVVEEHYGAPATVYATGQNPPGTAQCNAGHAFVYITSHPYPEDGGILPECDNCQNRVVPYEGIYHCGPCEVDLCNACGIGRLKPHA